MMIPEMLSLWLKFSIEILTKIPWMIIEFNTSIYQWFHSTFISKKVKSLHNEIAVVVGAGRSVFGTELALKLSHANATVVIVDGHLNSQASECLVEKITKKGEKGHFYECDVTDRTQLNQTIDSIEKDIGAPTMIFHGNLLQMDQQNEKLLMLSSVNLVDTLLPRMQTNDRGHLVFLSLINGIRDYKFQCYVEGLFDAVLTELRHLSNSRGVQATLINVHKKLINEDGDGVEIKAGIFGKVSVKAAVNRVIDGVRRNETYVTMPTFMTYATKITRFMPTSVSHMLLDMMYRAF